MRSGAARMAARAACQMIWAPCSVIVIGAGHSRRMGGEDPVHDLFLTSGSVRVVRGRRKRQDVHAGGVPLFGLMPGAFTSIWTAAS